MDARSLLLMVAIMAVCAAGVWWRTGRQHPEMSQADRRREICWCLGLLLVTAAITNMLSGNSTVGPGWSVLEVLGIAGVVVVTRPRLALGLLPAGLILLAGLVFDATRQTDDFTYLGGLDVLSVLILPLAYGLLLLGGWLGRRAFRALRARDFPAVQRALGQLANRPAPGRSLLLFPVVVMAAELLDPDFWTGQGRLGVTAAVLLLLACAWFIRRSPDRAATAATAGVLALGLVGLAIPALWVHWPLSRPPGGQILDGVLLVDSQLTAYLAVVQALALLAVGLSLVPRTIPRAGRLLGWAPDADLARRVQGLATSRAVAVDTAAADLRRLERDLHDGAQARLVALGMSLRTIERLIPVSPDAAVALVAEARQTSARALTELRELVRGVHPPVLADRGLGDAIRALALDTHLDIETEVDLPGRLAAPVETACYFAVAEILTNAAKHSGARAGRISAVHADGMLRIVVTDFGVGGADPARGSGLAGVERRLAAFDGIVAVSSPVGGPTMVVLEVPCASSSPRISSC
jgi:signal transduction histidine kinase